MGGNGFLMEIPLTESQDSASVVVEVDPREVPQDLVLAAPKPGAIVARARESLTSALEEVRPAVTAIVNWVGRAAPDAPTECTVEFGLKLGGQTSVIIATGTAEVNFVVKLTWKK
jgi:NTP-dependent ternary system trypsin peptidase co-occuring protein